jgi:amino acid transporter
MPRSGGDYIYIGRTIDPLLGFVANWGFTCSQLFGVGAYAGWVVSAALVPALKSIGRTTGLGVFTNISNWFNSDFRVFLGGLLVLLSVYAVSAFGLRLLTRFLKILFFIATLGTLLLVFVFWTHDAAELRDAFAQYMRVSEGVPDVFEYLSSEAKTRDIDQSGTTNFGSSLLAIPIGYWVFIGFTFSVYAGGEVQKPARSQTIAILGALAFGYLLYMTLLGRYFYVFGYAFNNAFSTLAADSSGPYLGNGSIAFLGALSADSVWVQVMIHLSTVLWFYLVLYVMVLAIVRNVFAWGIDSLVPSWITDVTDSGAPIKCLTVVAVLNIVFLALSVFGFMAFVNYIALFSICFLITGYAAVRFPWAKSKMFAEAPYITRVKVGGIPLIAIGGVFNMGLFSLVLYSCFTSPSFSAVNLPARAQLIIVGGIYAIGAAYYVWVVKVWKRDLFDREPLAELPDD